MNATLNMKRGSRARRGEKKRRWRGAEPIEMRERRYGYFPKAFTWRGHRYDVYAVERCWTVSRRRRGGRVERHYFRVRCSFGSAQDRPFDSAQDRPFGSAQGRREGTFEVYQDVRHNTWHICSR